LETKFDVFCVVALLLGDGFPTLQKDCSTLIFTNKQSKKTACLWRWKSYSQ